MAVLVVKLLSTQVSALQAAINTYLTGAGAGLLTAQRGMDYAAFFNPEDDTYRGLVALAHGGEDLPASKDADVQFVQVEASTLAAAQAALDAALSTVEYFNMGTADTAVSGVITVDNSALFTSDDVGRKVRIGANTRTVTSVTNHSPAAATGTVTCIAASLIVEGEQFVISDGALAARTFEFDSDASVTQTATLRRVTYTAAVTGAAATGSITCATRANLIDGETFTLDDGTNVATVFEFDVAGDGVTGGRVAVNVSGATTAADVAALVISAVNGVGAGLAITASSGGVGVVVLTNDATGAAGNVAVSDTVAHVSFTHTGMSGGVTAVAGSTAGQIRDAIITAINAATLAVTASISAATVVALVNDVNGAAGNVAITDTVANAGFTHTGISGGVSDQCDLAYTGTALPSATGQTLHVLGATRLQHVDVSVYRERDGDVHYVVGASCEGQLP